MAKMTKLRKAARGQDCMVIIPDVCNGNPETVVLAHLNGGGMGYKHHDFLGAWACSSCHSWLDGDYMTSQKWIETHRAEWVGRTDLGFLMREERDRYHNEAIIRTQIELIRSGIIEIK